MHNKLQLSALEFSGDGQILPLLTVCFTETLWAGLIFALECVAFCDNHGCWCFSCEAGCVSRWRALED